MLLRAAHRIVKTGEPLHKYPPVGQCIYCGRTPPEVKLSDEHIIADGLGGDLLLPKASCEDCGKVTGRYEQQALRGVLKLPRGVMGISSRKKPGKKRDKQTGMRMRVGRRGKLVETDVTFTPDMPKPFILFTTDRPPGILMGAPPDAGCAFEPLPIWQPDTFERYEATFGKKNVRHKYWMSFAVFGQVIAKTAHAFAVAKLGAGRFQPFLTDYIRADNLPFPSYYMSSHKTPIISDALHEIALEFYSAPLPTAVGATWINLYAVRLRLFANQGAPEFLVVVGTPT